MAMLASKQTRQSQDTDTGAVQVQPNTALSRLFERFTESSKKLEDKYAALTEEVEELKAQLRCKEEEIKQSERLAMLGETAAALAHEVRNPLGAITLFLSMLRTDVDDKPQAVGLLDEIERSITSLNNVVSNVLHFAKNNRITATPLNIHSILLELTQHFGNLYAPNVILTTDLKATAFLTGDDQALRQCIYNLVMNSLQATCFKGTVLISTQDVPDPDGVEIVIQDNGPGIPPELLPRLFEPFVSGRREGTGLGLSIVRRIVEAHGGKIKAENTPSARFTIHLPRRASDAQSGK